MKKINKELYIVEPNETIAIRIESINTANLSAISLDGEAAQVRGGHFEFQASAEKGTTHVLAFAFHFAGDNVTGSYRVNLAGSGGGAFTFSVNLSSSEPVLTLTRIFRVGSAGLDGPLGIEPPSPWPKG